MASELPEVPTSYQSAKPETDPSDEHEASVPLLGQPCSCLPTEKDADSQPLLESYRPGVLWRPPTVRER